MEVDHKPINPSKIEIKILGTGCTNCKTLQKNVEICLSQMGLEVNIEKVTDMIDIMSYGIMRTPGFVINNKVVSYGKLLNTAEIKKLILENM